MGGLKGQQWGIWNPSASQSSNTPSDDTSSLSGLETEDFAVSSPGVGNSMSGVSPGPMTPSRVNKRRFLEDEMDDGFRVEVNGRTMKLPKRRKFCGVQGREDGFQGWEYKLQIPVGGREIEMGGI